MIVPGQSYPITITRRSGTPGYNGPWRPQNIDRGVYTVEANSPLSAPVVGTLNDLRNQIYFPFTSQQGSDAPTLIDAANTIRNIFVGYPAHLTFQRPQDRGLVDVVWFVTAATPLSEDGTLGVTPRVQLSFRFGNAVVDLDEAIGAIDGGLTGNVTLQSIYAITSPGRTDADGTVQTPLPPGIGTASIDIAIAEVTGEAKTTTGVAMVETRDFESQINDPLGNVLSQAEDSLTVSCQKASTLFPAETTDAELLRATMTIDGEVYQINRISFGGDDSVIMEVVKRLDAI